MSWGAPDSFVSKSVTKSIRNTTENELEAPELFISKSVTVSTNTQPGNAPENSGTQVFENTREFKEKKNKICKLTQSGNAQDSRGILVFVLNTRQFQKKQDLSRNPDIA